MTDAIANAPATMKPRRSPLRRIATGIAILLTVLVAVTLLRFGPFLMVAFGPNHYAAVTSIETRTDYRNPQLMAAAWALPVATRYRQSPFEYQGNQSFCGPTSLADLLHAMGVATTQNAVIAGSKYDPWFGILIGGMTLDELADLVRQRVRAGVAIQRDPGLSEFRALMAASNDPGRRMIINFHRGPLFGRGGGHFSPILGYLPARDLVLVGDVNARYKPFLVPSERLWRAMQTTDEATGKHRGLIIVTMAAKLNRAA